MLVPRVMMGSGFCAFSFAKGPDGAAVGVRARQDEAPSCRRLPAEGTTPRGWSIWHWGARPPDWLQQAYLIHVNERLTPRQLHHLPHQTTLHFYDWLNVTLPHWHAFSLDRHPVRVRARKQTPQPKHTHSRLNTWIFPCSTTTISDDGRPLYPHSGYDRQS